MEPEKNTKKTLSFDDFFEQSIWSKETKWAYKSAIGVFMAYSKLSFEEIYGFCQNAEGRKEITKQIKNWGLEKERPPGKYQFIQAKALINAILEHHDVTKLIGVKHHREKKHN